MIITAITLQAHDNNRVNVFVDGVYQFSLDVFQLTELGLKVGYECDATKLASLKQESEFSKVYGRALEYCMMQPHSKKEVRDYLYRKTKTSKTRDGSLKPGISTFLRIYFLSPI
jgi:regulatory protein